VEGDAEKLQTNSEFGLYDAQFKKVDHSVVYTRRCERIGGEFPAERWDAYYAYRKKLAKSDKSKLVIKLGTNEQK
jgi:hypothetical protein